MQSNDSNSNPLFEPDGSHGLTDRGSTQPCPLARQ
jgi:hypothetical protein